MVNALWSGGAEAMTIQGQRVISTTGIKCVGNTVLLHGVPYSPPYVITAVGDHARCRRPGRQRLHRRLPAGLPSTTTASAERRWTIAAGSCPGTTAAGEYATA